MEKLRIQEKEFSLIEKTGQNKIRFNIGNISINANTKDDFGVVLEEILLRHIFKESSELIDKKFFLIIELENKRTKNKYIVIKYKDYRAEDFTSFQNLEDCINAARVLMGLNGYSGYIVATISTNNSSVTFFNKANLKIIDNINLNDIKEEDYSSIISKKNMGTYIFLNIFFILMIIAGLMGPFLFNNIKIIDFDTKIINKNKKIAMEIREIKRENQKRIKRQEYLSNKYKKINLNINEIPIDSMVKNLIKGVENE